MTGGHHNTTEINRALAHAASETGIAMGLGSQRAGLELNDGSVLKSYTVVRDAAPDAFIYRNLGAAQLREYDIGMVERAVEMIEADALAVHLNFLKKPFKPEGDVDGRNCLAAIERVAADLSVPIIVKETGNGFPGRLPEIQPRQGLTRSMSLEKAAQRGRDRSLPCSRRERTAAATDRHPVPSGESQPLQAQSSV